MWDTGVSQLADQFHLNIWRNDNTILEHTQIGRAGSLSLVHLPGEPNDKNKKMTVCRDPTLNFAFDNAPAPSDFSYDYWFMLKNN